MRCEVLIIGGGPAGVLLATKLKENGLKVVQLINPESGKGRPFEVLTPATRQLLNKYKLREPDIGSSYCNGVLSVWDDDTPDFYDYRLMTCMPGLCIDRKAFHSILQEDAASRGVYQVKINAIELQKGIEYLRKSRYGKLKIGSMVISPEIIINASGRNSNLNFGTDSEKININSQIALSVEHKVSFWNDYLLVEAIPEGWWYIPPTIEGRTQLVFLTDREILPSNSENRSEWLTKCYRQTSIVNKYAISHPKFDRIKGVSAKFFIQSIPILEGRVLVGDSALSLDPLSGSGTWAALRGAEKLSSLITSKSIIQQEYSNWLLRFFESELETFRETSNRALTRFPNSKFWKSRSDLR